MQVNPLSYHYIVAEDDETLSIVGDAIRGSSFSAPRVAAAIALVNQKYPQLTPAQIKQVILESADPLCGNSHEGTCDTNDVSTAFGHGKLNVEAALQMAESILE